MTIKPPLNPSTGSLPVGGVSRANYTNTGELQRDWFGDLDKGSQLPIMAPVSPNLINHISIIERVDSIISHLESR